MYNNFQIAIVIPAFKVSKYIINDVILTLPDFVDYIIVVDDACPESTGLVVNSLNNNKVIVLHHATNQGVGAAVITGYKQALSMGCDIAIKMDGDGQMSSSHLEDIIAPIIANEADYTKGNRFRDMLILKKMPKFRLFGNSCLSFILKFVSGYWNVMDPCNGYTAINTKTLMSLDLSKISQRYFFECDMLINLNILNAVIKDVPIPVRYGDEISSLSIGKTLCQFPMKLLYGYIKRIGLKYFLYDFNMASVYLILGVPLFLWGLIFGIYQWVDSSLSQQLKSAGTIMLAALPIILGFQMLLMFIQIDISNTPKR